MTGESVAFLTDSGKMSGEICDVRMLRDFLLMVVGNAIFYQGLFLLTDFGASKKVFGIQFQSDFWYVAFFTLLTLPLGYLGGFFFNYAYLRQAIGHGSNLWFPQFVVWCSAPTAFFILNTFQRHTPVDTRTMISLMLLFAAMLVKYWK